MVSVNNLSMHFTGTDLFTDVTFQLNDRDKVGLTGKNGSGKTTLLRIVAGETEPQKGEVIVPSGATLGYLPQEMQVKSDKSILDEASVAFSELLELESKIHQITVDISERQDYESADYQKLIISLNELNERYLLLGGQSRRADTEKVLLGLGFVHKDFNRPVKEFSHGWRMRVELAKILLARPRIVLLDEPTNHLDIESIQWLEDFLKDYNGIVVIVSHDRTFLDNITNRTIEIDAAKVYDYRAGFSDYIAMREERLAGQMAAYNNQQRQIRQIERFIERFRYKNTKARQVQSRIRMLEKMDEIEIDDRDTSGIRFVFPPAPRSGKVVIETRGLSKNYGSTEVLKELDLTVIKGDKVAFVGKNGEGKTTLSRIITGELDYSGELKFGHNVIFGYHAQDQEGHLDPDMTVFDTLDAIAVGDIRKQLRNILGAFLFSGEDADKKVKVLSGGEKSRLSLARLLLTPVNLLILDEPTNHLDMASKDVLKNALLKYDGTLIIVSHDRDFLQGLTGKVFEFRNKKVKEHLGDIFDFLENKKMEHLRELEKGRTRAESLTGERGNRKAEWEKKKQQEREQRRLRSRIIECEERIENLEKQLKQQNGMLSDPEKHREQIASGELYKDYRETKNELEKEMERWEDLHRQLEKTEGA
ncbi:MAG: ATP-binding cassette domain-containing protein [Bacteroidales bacterium]|nr:ATP-binding cassette domain-containing protein [Bacteroidales bacterium]